MGMRITEARLRRDNNLPDGFVFYHYEWLKSGNEYKIMRLNGGVCPLPGESFSVISRKQAISEAEKIYFANGCK